MDKVVVMIFSTDTVINDMHNPMLGGAHETRDGKYVYVHTGTCKCGAHAKYVNHRDALRWVDSHRWSVRNMGRDTPLKFL